MTRLAGRAVADFSLVSDKQAPSSQTDATNVTDGRTPGDDPRANLESLVGEWVTVPDIAERLGVPLSKVRQYLADREVLSSRVGPRRVPSIPAKFFDPSGPRPELKGTFTVLTDGGMDDDEIIEWLFTPDPTLPVDGAPIDALRAGHKTEIRRRAQELAF